MTWQSGQTLQAGKYIIEGILGSGGFGITYRAKETATNRTVAIKTLNYQTQQKPNFAKLQEDFMNEALCLAKCTHPHIVQVYRVFQEDGLWAMLMEYIDGITLADYIEDREILSQQDAFKIIQQMGTALTNVHDRQFLHRDVKPLNILLRNKTIDPVLIDFGLAREFTLGTLQTHTNYRTEHFAPIEQYERKAERGPYTDVYALSATWYTMRTGKLPYPANFRQEANLLLVPPQQHNPNISNWENDLILTGMILEPHKRPQTIQEWLGEETDDLTSARGIDYQKLRDLLKAGKWKEADQETARVMLKVANREEEGWLRVEDIDNFPCEDLRTIDQLWVKYSHGRFGFSVQKRIYQSLGGTREYDSKIWNAFGERVGWRVNNNWLYYKDLTFSAKAPEGHLPGLARRWVQGSRGGTVGGILFSRIETCKV